MSTFLSQLLDPSAPTSASLIFNMAYALLLGVMFGYERFYHGRAAGMRTYGLVCMVAAGLTSASLLPNLWLGGHPTGQGIIDPTRTIQGIMTGIGFLGAGIIMQDGLKISGLTTAASIWAVAAIGILAGFGLHVAALALALFCMSFMMWGAWAASHLPNRQPIAVTLKFRKGFSPKKEMITQFAIDHGYELAHGTLTIDYNNNQAEWHFVAVSMGRDLSTPVSELSQKLPLIQGIESFHLARARN